MCYKMHMASIVLSDDALTVALTKFEQVEAIHSSVTVPRSAVVSARTVADAMDEVHGIRAPGTGVPGMLMIGTLRDHGVTTFAVCHGHRRAVLVELSGQEFDRLLVTTDDADDVVSRLSHE